LVAIHPFPDGNGRHARLLTDALLEEMQMAPFTWGSGSSRPLPSLTVGRRKTMQDEVGLLQSAISCWSRLERRARRSAADNAENGRIRAGGWQGGPLPSLPVTARPLPTLLWTHYLHWAAEPGLVSPGPRAALRYEDSQLARFFPEMATQVHRTT
jgi:hypothetical protein